MSERTIREPVHYPAQPILQPVAPSKPGLLRRWDYRNVCEYAWTGERERIIVPAGFIHDGASVPRLGWSGSGLTPTGAISAAALVHDWLYRHDGRLPRGSYLILDERFRWIESPAVFTRRQADDLFKQLMAGVRPPVRPLQRRIAYFFVRVGARRW